MAFGTDQSPGLQDVENRCTLGSAASGHLVKAPLVRARAPTGALGDTENDADAGSIELVAQDSVPPSRRSLAGKRIEGEGRAVNIEPFVLQKHLRAGFHVFLSVRLESLLRTAFGDLADAARHYTLNARIPPSCLAPPSRGRYRGRGCVSDPTQRNK